MAAGPARRRGHSRRISRKRGAAMRKFLCSVLAALASVGTAFSQGLSTINGSIADSSGALVSGAKITVTEVDTGLARETVSNGEGLYVLSSLRPTRYALTVEAPGFRRFSESGVTLQTNDTTTINVRLEVGALSEVSRSRRRPCRSTLPLRLSSKWSIPLAWSSFL